MTPAGVLSLMGYTTRSVDVRAFPLAVPALSHDGLVEAAIGTLPTTPAVRRPWHVLAVRCDLGAIGGRLDGVQLGTSSGKADIFTGSLPVGVWVPHLYEVPHRWDGQVYATTEGADLDTAPVFLNTLSTEGLGAALVGSPLDEDTGHLAALTGTDFATFTPGVAGTSRTIGILATPTTPTGTYEHLCERSSGAGGFGFERTGAGKVYPYLHNQAGSQVFGGASADGFWPDDARSWLFARCPGVVADGSDMEVRRYLAGSAAAAASYDRSRTGSVETDWSNSVTILGAPATVSASNVAWSGSIEQVAVWDGLLSDSDMGRVSQASDPAAATDGLTLVGGIYGAAADAIAGATITLLCARER